MFCVEFDYHGVPYHYDEVWAIHSFHDTHHEIISISFLTDICLYGTDYFIGEDIVDFVCVLKN